LRSNSFKQKMKEWWKSTSITMGSIKGVNWIYYKVKSQKGQKAI
jgi:hypothetical protein